MILLPNNSIRDQAKSTKKNFYKQDVLYFPNKLVAHFSFHYLLLLNFTSKQTAFFPLTCFDSHLLHNVSAGSELVTVLILLNGRYTRLFKFLGVNI